MQQFRDSENIQKIFEKRLITATIISIINRISFIRDGKTRIKKNLGKNEKKTHQCPNFTLQTREIPHEMT